jgi:ComF family protein
METLIQFLKSQFLPGQCCLCQQAADIKLSLCEKCFSELSHNKFYCTTCATPLNSFQEHNKTLLQCGSCLQEKPYFDHVFSPFLYQHQMVQLIHQFKYHAKLFLARTLSDIFIQQYQYNKHNLSLPEIMIPVPLHIKRLKQRGFNQSKELATYLSKQMDIKIRDDIVARVKLTHTQRGLSLKERKKNLKNAFTINNRHFNKKHVVIVDDVMTTGNTANEIAKVLKQAGVKYVDVWTIARA